MSKRQTRLSTPQQITSKLSEISGKKVNIALKSGAVMFVEITSVADEVLQLKNMRQTSSSLNIDQIAEIIVDIEA